MAIHQKVPAGAMRDLRRMMPAPPGAIRTTPAQFDAARWLGVSKRTVMRWESDGAPAPYGWAYVGLAFRFGGSDLARRAVRVLGQPELEAPV